MQHFIDQMGRTVSLATWPPRRIVSLVPSQTELLYDLGLEDEVVGITKFCVHPPVWFQVKKRIGGTKTVHFQKIQALSPDLILGNKEENEREQIEQLAADYPVWMSDVEDLAAASDMMRRVGELTGTTAAAGALAGKIERAFAAGRLPAGTRRKRVAYFIWRKPYMIAAGDTFIHAMLTEAGFENVFADRVRYPEIALGELAARQPELLFLSSEPFPFAEKHFAAFREACPQAKVHLVDGEMFSWYGSRLQYAPAYFRSLRKSMDLVAS